jgi:6-phosphogluconolactonase
VFRRKISIGALLSLLACNSSSEQREPVRDASSARDAQSADRDGAASADAAQNAPRDGATADASGASDANTAALGDGGARDGGEQRGDAGGAGDGGGSGSDGGGAPMAIESLVYVGGADGNGRPYPFKSYRLNRQTGALSVLESSVDLGQNPTYIAPSGDGRFLYVANEVGSNTAAVTVAAIDDGGKLSRLEQESLPGGGGVVFTSLHPTGKYLLAADYNGGRAAVFRVESDGKLSAPVHNEPFADGAHSHCIRTDPTGKWAYVPNKDLHNVAQFAFDAATGKLAPISGAPTLAVAGGPRHIAFTPDGRYAFVILEYDDKVNAYAVGPNGALSPVDSQSSLPANVNGANNTGAHVLVHPSGKFVYGSNRGDDSIVVFSVDAQGKLSLLQHVATRGKTPRNFDIDATGQLLVVANQGQGENGGSLAVFAIGGDGKLSALGTPVGGLTAPQAVAIINRRLPASAASQP